MVLAGEVLVDGEPAPRPGMKIPVDSIIKIKTRAKYVSRGGEKLTEALNQSLREKLSYCQALLEAGTSRFRPVVLTSLTTIAGLAPLILANNPDAQQTVPMAISVAYGLIIATGATLLVLPALLSLTQDLRQLLARWWPRREIT